MNPIFIIPVALVLFAVILDLVVLVVCKLPVSEKKLDAFFAKHLESYKKSGMNDNCEMFYGLSEKPYIAKFPLPLILGPWCFGNEIGRIPRWSKWHMVLNEMQKEMKGKRGIEKYL